MSKPPHPPAWSCGGFRKATQHLARAASSEPGKSFWETCDPILFPNIFKKHHYIDIYIYSILMYPMSRLEFKPCGHFMKCFVWHEDRPNFACFCRSGSSEEHIVDNMKDLQKSNETAFQHKSTSQRNTDLLARIWWRSFPRICMCTRWMQMSYQEPSRSYE